MKKESADQTDEDNHHKRVMTEVAQLNAPNSFGEIALMDYKARAATIK